MRARNLPRPRPARCGRCPCPRRADALLRWEIVERGTVVEADEVLAAQALDVVAVGEHVDGDPVTVLAAPVLRVRLHRRSHVGRQRPWRRRPDHQRLALALDEREADEERRMLQLFVVLVAGLLVLRERRAAARAPLRRAMAHVQPAAVVDVLEEAPDVLDVRVAEGEVGVLPVHPHPEPLRLLGLDAGKVRDELAAASGELADSVLLDLALRVQP